jgi:hypothetical protein
MSKFSFLLGAGAPAVLLLAVGLSAVGLLAAGLLAVGLPAAAVQASGQEPSERERVVALIDRLGGKAVVDEQQPGHPIVAVDI